MTGMPTLKMLITTLIRLALHSSSTEKSVHEASAMKICVICQLSTTAKFMVRKLNTML